MSTLKLVGLRLALAAGLLVFLTGGAELADAVNSVGGGRFLGATHAFAFVVGFGSVFVLSVILIWFGLIALTREDDLRGAGEALVRLGGPVEAARLAPNCFAGSEGKRPNTGSVKAFEAGPEPPHCWSGTPTSVKIWWILSFVAREYC